MLGILVSCSVATEVDSFVGMHGKVRHGWTSRSISVSAFGGRVNGDNVDLKDDTDDNLDEDMRRREEMFDSLTKELFASKGGKMPPNPFARDLMDSGSAGKGSMYSDEDLRNLLSTHEDISAQINVMPEPVPSASDGPSFSLHDLVVGAISEEGEDDESNAYNLSPDLQSKSKRIRAIASDVDGTLLSSTQTLHPRTRVAIHKAVELASTYTPSSSHSQDAFFFFPATGKSRKGALSSLGVEISTLFTQSNIPGVYLQGLYCVDGHGNVIFERKLSTKAVAAVEQLAHTHNISIVGYDGDFLCTTDQTDIVQHLHTHYGEPMPTLLHNGTHTQNLSQHEPRLHKILLLDDDTHRLKHTVRPLLEALAAQHGAGVTQALPTMLEYLPANCSKHVGVQRLCEALNIDMATELLALGDAENDAEMLHAASIGVTMGNGCAVAKRSADYVMEETNDDGAAGLAMELFVFPNKE